MDEVAYILSAIVAIVVGFHAVIAPVLQVAWSVFAWDIVDETSSASESTSTGITFSRGFVQVGHAWSRCPTPARAGGSRAWQCRRPCRRCAPLRAGRC